MDSVSSSFDAPYRRARFPDRKATIETPRVPLRATPDIQARAARHLSERHPISHRQALSPGDAAPCEYRPAADVICTPARRSAQRLPFFLA
jgi:hypothetical protein